jgi:hypothetical protein
MRPEIARSGLEEVVRNEIFRSLCCCPDVGADAVGILARFNFDKIDVLLHALLLNSNDNGSTLPHQRDRCRN